MTKNETIFLMVFNNIRTRNIFLMEKQNGL